MASSQPVFTVNERTFIAKVDQLAVNGPNWRLI